MVATEMVEDLGSNPGSTLIGYFGHETDWIAQGISAMYI